MKKFYVSVLFFCILFAHLEANEPDLVKKSLLKTGDLRLSRSVQPQSYFESVGQKSAILGKEDGNSEVWIYPYKVLHDFRLYFLMEDENTLLDGRSIAQTVDIYPHQTIIRYVHSSFLVEEIFFTPLRESGAVILLSVETVKPLSIIVSFSPDLKPMWPAGLGGQYSYWDKEKKYFVLSEGTRKNVALVGSPLGERFSTGPAHALPEEDLKFKIYTEPHQIEEYFIPVYVSASHKGRKNADETFSHLSNDFMKLYHEKFYHYERLQREFLSIQTPDKMLNQAFEWAKVAVDKAFVCNPQLGCGLVAGYGLSGKRERPGFAWFFGGDTFFNSLALNSFGSFDISQQSLDLIRKNQRQDGKIMHELSQGAAFIPWFEEYPYGFYHAETTPYYIVSVQDHLNYSGDFEFLRKSWPSLKKAYNYMLSADTDNDGLMENTVAGLAALELGAFLKKTKTDIYLAALSVEAFKAFSEMAALLGEKKLAQQSRKLFNKALATLRNKFWVEEEKKYAHALTVEDKPLRETTIWPFMPLLFSLLPPDKADHTLDTFASSEMSTDWGVRSLSPNSAYYDPLNYNYGTVWPFLTGYTCLAEYKNGRAQSGFSHLMQLAHNTFIDALGFCSELFSGEFFAPLEESVPHQVFSSSPIITCLARGLLGLGGNALKKEIEFKPNFPGTWDRVEIKNFRLGKENFYIGMERGKKKLTFRIKSHLKIPYRLFLCPSLGYGTQIESVRVNGIDKDFNIENEKGEVRCCLFLEIEDLAEIEIEYGEGIFLHRQPRFPQVGDKTTDLKIVRVQYMDNQMEILTEGLGGKTYFLSLVTPRTILSYNGAKIHDEENLKKKLILSFEEAKSGYSRKEILIKFK